MSSHKTVIENDLVLEFVKSIYTESANHFEMIVGGEGSQAYKFDVGDDLYVIRINKHTTEGFKKDEYAWKHFSSIKIPIPKIYHIGKMPNGYSFCISERVNGSTVDSFDDEILDHLKLDLIEVLEAVHSIDIKNSIGFGKWDEYGVGQTQSWRERVLSAGKYLDNDSEMPDIFETTFLEKDLCEKMFQRMSDLLQFCPEEKHIVHGDPGLGNTLSDGIKITGLIDWENSLYGDFVFDIAWLSFWSRKNNVESMYLAYCERIGKKVLNFSERILCYKISIALRTASFYAYSNQETKYIALKEKIAKLLI